MVRPRKTYGNILCPGADFVVRGFGPSAAMPILRINRCTRLRLTAWPRPSMSAPQQIRQGVAAGVP
jgi:hypothetical protein